MNGSLVSKIQRIVRDVNNQLRRIIYMGNYPPGLENDPSAPYNQEEVEELEEEE